MMLKQANLPPLAQFKPRLEYEPAYGDYVIWSRWFSTWHGFVVGINKETDTLSIIWAGIPFLLLTMDEAEQAKETKSHGLNRIRHASNGQYAIQQTAKGGSQIWFI